MISRLTLIFILILTINTSGFSQTLKAFIRAAEEAVSEKDFYTSYILYQTASDIAENRVDLKYQFAEAARLYQAYTTADSIYQQVLESEENNMYPLAAFWLGKVKQMQGKYDEAINYYQIYLTEHENEDTYYTPLTRKQIESCRWALDNIRATDGSLTVARLGEEVNTAYSEVAALHDGDVLYYSSLRYYPKREKKVRPEYPELPIAKVLRSEEGSNGELLDSTVIFNDEKLHTAHLTFNYDSTRLYYTICSYVNKSEIRCDLYYRDILEGVWGDPQKMPDPINMDQYTTTQPDLAYDEELGKEVLYFVSDREGGEGKLDIWYSVVNDASSFTKPLPLSEINTPEDDLTPFYHNASSTLFFSSDGYLGFGGYDIYKAERNGSTWDEAVNLGSDINSSYHDAYYTLNDDESEGYLSSNRLGSLFLEEDKEACCYDIYKVTAKPIKVNLIVETFNKRTGEPLNNVTLYVERKNGEVAMVTHSTGESNTITVPLKRNKNYTVIANKDSFDPDTVLFPTYRITESIDITKKMFLNPSSVILEVRTFDKRQRQPLPNVTVSVNNLATSEKFIKTEEFSSITYFSIQPGGSYLIEGTRKGYRKATADLPESEFDVQDTIVKELYLELGNLEDFLPLAIYFDNDEPEPNSNSTFTNKSYLQTYTPYFAKKDKFKRRYSRGLKGQEKIEAEDNVDAFFEDSLRRKKVEFESFLNILDQYLDEGLSFKIFLKGYTSPLAPVDYNYNLGQRRINTVQNEFKAFRGGVLQKYFQSNDVEVTEKSFGEEEAPPYVSDDRTDLRRSVYSPEASIERRVEIIEIQKDNPQQ